MILSQKAFVWIPDKNGGGAVPVKIADYAVFSSSRSWEVQCGHLVASIGISLRQYGHFFVVGAAGASGFLPIEASLFTAFKRQNRTNAMIRKFTRAETKLEAKPATS